MKATLHKRTNGPAYLARPAEDVMTRNPLSVREGSTIREAAAFLTANDISAAPVIDAAGRPIGVLSRTDIVRHMRADAVNGFDDAKATDIMTPLVLFVRPHTPVGSVIGDLLESGVHRLFVVDDHGVLIGVISPRDLLRELQAEFTTQRGAVPDVASRRYGTIIE